MAYDFLEFCEDCRQAILLQNNCNALENIRQKLEELLKNPAFVSKYCGPTNEIGVHTLYHDREFDFMVLAHISDRGRKSPPHDHGESWAIYGQAVGQTIMREYERLDDGKITGKAEIKQIKEYRLEPGCAGIFGPRQIHSISFSDGARFVRVTGKDLSKISTRKFDQENRTVTDTHPELPS